MSALKTLVVLTTFFSLTLQQHKLPSYFKKCKRTGPEINQCFKEAIQEALPHLKNGIKDLGVAPIEPLVIPEVQIAEGQSAVRFSQNYKDFKIYNMSKSIIDRVDMRFKNDEFFLTIDAHLDELIFVSDYTINGRILVLPIQGNGTCVINLNNVKFHMFLDAASFVQGDVNYVKVANLTVKTDIDKLTLHFDNLFNGNKELGDPVNQALNDNWKDIYADLGKSYEELFETVFMDFINKIFTKVPFNEFFTD